MSSIDNPATLRTFWMAGTGPIPMISGGTPTVEYATNLANGFNPFALTASSDASITEAAPSQIPYIVDVRSFESRKHKKLKQIRKQTSQWAFSEYGKLKSCIGKLKLRGHILMRFQLLQHHLFWKRASIWPILRQSLLVCNCEQVEIEISILDYIFIQRWSLTRGETMGTQFEYLNKNALTLDARQRRTQHLCPWFSLGMERSPSWRCLHRLHVSIAAGIVGQMHRPVHVRVYVSPPDFRP